MRNVYFDKSIQHGQKIQICHFDERSEEKSQNIKIKISLPKFRDRNDTPCLVVAERSDLSEWHIPTLRACPGYDFLSPYLEYTD
jgi:hypothetical protein